MARFYFEVRDEDDESPRDYETLCAGFEEFVGLVLTDSSRLVEDLLSDGAIILQECYKEYLTANHFVSGKLADSIDYNVLTHQQKVIVGPMGKHHGVNTSTKGTHRSKTGQGKSYSRKHHGMRKGATAQEVGYFLEFGSPRMKATHWMEIANEIAADRIFAAQEAIYDNYLKYFFEKFSK